MSHSTMQKRHGAASVLLLIASLGLVAAATVVAFAATRPSITPEVEGVTTALAQEGTDPQPSTAAPRESAVQVAAQDDLVVTGQSFVFTVVPEATTSHAIGSFTVQTNDTWSVAGCGDWLVCTATQQVGGGMVQLNFNADAFSVAAAGSRSITVQAGGSTQAVVVTAAVAQVSAPLSLIVCHNQPTTLQALLPAGSSFSWNRDDGNAPVTGTAAASGVITTSTVYTNLGVRHHQLTAVVAGSPIVTAGDIAVVDCTVDGKLTLYGAAAAKRFEFDRSYFGRKP